MATSERTMEILLEVLSSIPTIRTRKMFGEFAVYVENKVVGFVYDDRLLLKITPVSRGLVRTQATGKLKNPLSLPYIICPCFITHKIKFWSRFLLTVSRYAF